jgi:hypothetical protein
VALFVVQEFPHIASHTAHANAMAKFKTTMEQATDQDCSPAGASAVRAAVRVVGSTAELLFPYAMRWTGDNRRRAGARKQPQPSRHVVQQIDHGRGRLVTDALYAQQQASIRGEPDNGVKRSVDHTHKCPYFSIMNAEGKLKRAVASALTVMDGNGRALGTALVPS